MANVLSPTCVFECRTTGSDTTCSGAFDPGVASPGTDYSQQDSPQITFSDITIGSTNSQVTSNAHAFSSLHPGNTLLVPSGISGFNAGLYLIKSVSGGVATLDQAIGNASTTQASGSIYLGGANASPGYVFGQWVASNTLYLKQGTYSISSSRNVSGGYCYLNPLGTTAKPNTVIGYNSNRVYGNTDTPPILSAGAASIILMQNYNGGAFVVFNLQFNSNSQSGCTGLFFDNPNNIGEQLIFNGSFLQGVSVSSNEFSQLYNCYAKSCLIGFENSGYGNWTIGCVADSCGAANLNQGGFYDPGQGTRYIQCIARNCKGYGFIGNVENLFMNCTCDNTSVGQSGTGSGFYIADKSSCVNCLSTNNGRYGFESLAGSLSQFQRLYNCAGYNNTSGNYDSNFGQNFNFQALTANPYNNASGGDYSLNNNPGGGRVLRAAGYLAAFPQISTNNYFDIGAVQHLIGDILVTRPTVVR